MADETTTENTAEEQQNAPQEPAEQQTEATPQGEADNASETPSSESEGESKLSHEDALAALAKTRKSEANYRTRLRDLEKKYADAKTPEEYGALLEEVKEANAAEAHALMVENVSLKHDLPGDLTQALVEFAEGRSREQVEAHAKLLSKYVSAPKSNDDLTGGLDPNSDDDDFDPEAFVKELNKNRRR